MKMKIDFKRIIVAFIIGTAICYVIWLRFFMVRPQNEFLPLSAVTLILVPFAMVFLGLPFALIEFLFQRYTHSYQLPKSDKT